MRLLARYAEWANAGLYDACMQLSREQYHAGADNGSPSLHGLLNRMLVFDRLIQSRLDGYEPSTVVEDDEQHRTFTRMRDALVAEDVAISDCVRHLSEDELELPVTYADENGTWHTNSQGELLVELFMHQADLRGAVCQRLREFGVEPPSLAYTHFLREIR